MKVHESPSGVGSEPQFNGLRVPVRTGDIVTAQIDGKGKYHWFVRVGTFIVFINNIDLDDYDYAGKMLIIRVIDIRTNFAIAEMLDTA